MGIATGQVSVTTSATQVITESLTANVVNGTTVTVVNSGSTTAYLGKSNVTTATGFPLVAGAGLSLDFLAPTDLYVISATTGTVGYLFERI